MILMEGFCLCESGANDINLRLPLRSLFPKIPVRSHILPITP